MRQLPARIAVALFALACAGAAHAAQVYYAKQSLGGNRWLYVYQLDRFPYSTGYGFSVYFDPALYASIALESPLPGSDWDPIVVQPDLGLGAEGYYDAEALFDDATPHAAFRVSFKWLGTGTPGDQPFEMREPSPSYDVVESGITVAPEPTALLQHASTLLALAGLATRGRSRA